MFSKKFIDDVRTSANIVEIVGETIELNGLAGDRFKGLCPFHNESSPSFTVDNNLYFCFGCGEGGDVIRFIERTHDITFGAAVRLLADRYGIVNLDSTQPYRHPKPIKRKISGIRQPEGYVAPSEISLATYDSYAAQLLDDLYQPDYDLLLTLGIVPTSLVMELLSDVSLSDL
jgi:DNA primase